MKIVPTASALLLALVAALTACADDGPRADWKPVEEALGRAGELQKDGSFKVTVLRTDVQVKTAQGMPVPAGLGLNSYAAFAGTPEKAAVVGDTCLLAGEVQGVIDALRAGGIEVVALHNHMLADEPRLLFLHFQGTGEARVLAKALRPAFDRIGATVSPTEAAVPAVSTGTAGAIDWEALAKVLGRPAKVASDGTGKFTLPRSDLDVSLAGTKLAPGVGLACWAAFYACPCGRTMVMGDTCVKPHELQGAIDALRRGGVNVTGIHNHMLGESEQVMFLHFEGEGDAEALGRAIRAAWDGLGVSKGAK